MLRKLTIVLAAVAAGALFVSDAASARGGFGGGHGGGFGGFHGGGFHGFHGGGFHHGFGFGVGLGFAAPYGYDGYPYYDPSYVDDDGYFGGDCYLVRRRVMTRHGRRLRTVQVCN